MKRWLRTAVLAASCLFVASQARAACNANDNVIVFKGALGDFADYGLLFYDAQSLDADCVRSAATRLKAKLENELGRGFRGFLGGGDVYLAMATGLILGGSQVALDPVLKSQLDGLLNTVATTGYSFDFRYDFQCNAAARNNPAGGLAAASDTCMDEYVTAAAAYAWSAAYLAKSGRSAATAVGLAIANLNLSFSLTDSVCVRVRQPQDGTLNCNACLTDISAGDLYTGILNNTLEVDSYNGVILPSPDVPKPPPSGENPNYGVGLLTSVSAAITGLSAAGVNWTPTDVQKILAQGLTRQGQKRTLPAPDGTPHNSCEATWSPNQCLNLNPSLDPILYPNVGVCTKAVDCADPDKGGVYKPTFYPVHDILFRGGRFGLTDGRSSLLFDGRFAFDCQTFPDGAFAPTGFLNYARRAVYRDLAWDWPFNSKQPTLAGLNFTAPPVDVTPPRMWVDVPQYYQAVSGLTAFYGWAIDAVSNVTVSFSIDGQPLSGIGYGGTRPDVCATLQIPKDPACSVGWGGIVNTAAYANGLHTLYVTATDASRNSDTYSRLFVINNIGMCQASPPVGPSNQTALNAGYYDYLCGYYLYALGYDPSGYCSQAASLASMAGVSTAGTGRCTGGTFYNYYAGVYDYYCRYYESVGYGWDFGSYCSTATYYANIGGCTGCGQTTPPPPPCQPTARTIWIQPQARAGFGPPNSLVLAGSASSTGSCGEGGVDVYWRVIVGGPWTHVPYTAPVGSDGIWYNAIENANPYSVYETYVTYKNGAASYCTYDGRNDIVWCQ